MGKLLPVMPVKKGEKASQLDSFFFWNSGAEAVEVCEHCSLMSLCDRRIEARSRASCGI
jgi:adenosylmethionine-8-amino-7-oxononanoate aminotransferase